MSAQTAAEIVIVADEEIPIGREGEPIRVANHRIHFATELGYSGETLAQIVTGDYDLHKLRTLIRSGCEIAVAKQILDPLDLELTASEDEIDAALLALGYDGQASEEN
jgi:predicted nucleic acid-binding protein